MAFGAVDANAMALGRIKVLSTLGEPLRAEIDIAEITTAEAESLRVSPASPETFRAAGLEFDSVISSVRVAVQRRANGRPFLRLSSSRPVNDPFMDLILNVSSSSGQISRDFTMLFDPQGGRGSAPGVIPPAAQSVARANAVAASASRARAADANTREASPASDNGAAATPSAASPRSARTASPSTARGTTAAPTSKTAAEGASRIKVRSGDTASRIASANLPVNVSLDQMLVAMLRTNPGAFVDGNVNRIKAGAVLDMPTTAQATEQTDPQARETLNAQSKDFNAFRRKLATAATPAPASGRADSGKLQTAVQESNPVTTSPDKLTLSKGSVDRPAAADGSAASAGPSGTKSAAAVADNNSGNATSSAAGSGIGNATAGNNGANTTGAPSATTIAATSPDGTNNSTMALNGAPLTLGLTAPASATGTSAATGVGTPSATTTPGSTGERSGTAGGTLAAGVQPTAASEPGLVEQMLEEPVLPAAGLGLLALLAGFGIWRSRRNKSATELNHLHADSQTDSESIFSMSGGRNIDTLHGSTGVAPIAYSPSQLDAGGEVDPVAEADVYMAYGREEQALEILKEALRTSPARADVRVKLLEVHARRREVKAFEALARDTRAIVGDDDSRDWRRICEIGRELDFKNSLYQAPISAAVPLQGGAVTAAMVAGDVDAAPSSVMPTQSLSSGFGGLVGAAGPVGSAAWLPSRSLDLDLDFGAIRAASASATQPASLSRPIDLDLDLSDFGSLESSPQRTSAQKRQAPPAWMAQPDASADKPAFIASNRSALPTMPAPVEAPPSSVPDTGVIDFDFSSLRLELDDPVVAQHTRPPAASSPVIAAPLTKPERASAPDLAFDASHAPAGGTFGADDDDSLSTKLALAEAFSAIGDADGARSLAHEVIGESSGTLKAKAQRFLASID
ncbi:MAG: FimV/HubP family polar landmark protein [Rhodoferax sp.]